MQHLVDTNTDYSFFEKQIPILDSLSMISNVGVTVFDLKTLKHIYVSHNFPTLFGEKDTEIFKKSNDYLDNKIHPEDKVNLTEIGASLLQFIMLQPSDERFHYKAINEYRIMGKENTYIKFIEQHQLLEHDEHDNLWLTLGTIDVSPNQNISTGVSSQVYNFKTGKLIKKLFQNGQQIKDENQLLTKRELEILQHIKEGKFSKEISDLLSISVHTVNTHRQKILEKLAVDNSVAAISFAEKFGLLK